MRTTPCTARVDRQATTPDGMASRPAWITITMADLTYRLLLDVPAYGTADDANDLAGLIVAGVQATSMEIASLRDRAERAEAVSRTAQAASQLDRERLSEVLIGKTRRLSGQALVVLGRDGGCWLQDPDKGDHGMGIYYPSLAALWQDMPSLRPISWDGGRLIVESCPIRPPLRGGH